MWRIEKEGKGKGGKVEDEERWRREEEEKKRKKINTQKWRGK